MDNIDSELLKIQWNFLNSQPGIPSTIEGQQEFIQQHPELNEYIALTQQIYPYIVRGGCN